jgi:hypothetical protein
MLHEKVSLIFKRDLADSIIAKTAKIFYRCSASSLKGLLNSERPCGSWWKSFGKLHMPINNQKRISSSTAISKIYLHVQDAEAEPVLMSYPVLIISKSSFNNFFMKFNMSQHGDQHNNFDLTPV